MNTNRAVENNDNKKEVEKEKFEGSQQCINHSIYAQQREWKKKEKK